MKLKSLAALAALCLAGAASAASFNGVVGAGSFSVPMSSTFVVGAGQQASVSFGVGSSPVDIVVPVSPTLSVPVHYDALTFLGATIQSTLDPAVFMTDTDLSNGAFFTVIAPGTYILKFTGSSSTGGFYAGDYSVSIASVPEPESMVLALAGMGIVGGAVLRRRRVI